MRSIPWFKTIIVVVALFLALPARAGFSQPIEDIELGKNLEIIILTPGVSRAIYYNLHNTLTNDPTALQLTLIFTIGAGTLDISSANMSDLGGGEMLLVLSGFVGATPILQYAYSSGYIFMPIPVGNVSAGMIISGILVGLGKVDMPVTIGSTYQLRQ